MLTELENYLWPGNIRELQHIIERAVILTKGTQLATVNCVNIFSADAPASTAIATLEEAERAHILKALEATAWRIAGDQGAAKILAIPSTTLRSRMEKLRIQKSST
jgi:transcriptional regulator of acetoin/glycerol metabolism